MAIEALIHILHKNQKRKSGDDYVTHPLAVRNILVKVGVSNDIILNAALVHDVLEDSTISKDYLVHKCGSKVANIVDILTKKSIWKTSYAKMNSSLSEIGQHWIDYPEATVIKMADRLHNLQTVQAFSLRKQQEYIAETQNLLLPLFRKILKKKGLGELENPISKLLRKIENEVQKFTPVNNCHNEYI